MKKNVLLFALCSIAFALWGKESSITEGVWYISFPENSGEIKASEAAYRFDPQGNAEIIYSGKAAKEVEKMHAMYKKRTGKDFPTPKLTWKSENNRLYIYMTMPGIKISRQEMFIFGKNPQIMFAENKQAFFVLARKGAKMTPEQAKQYWKDIREASRDKFADNLKLPENVKLAEPENAKVSSYFGNHQHWKCAPANSFQQVVVSAINKGVKLADDAECNIPALAKLLETKETKAVLMQYLACHPEWRLYPEKDGSLRAVRYFCTPDGKIVPSLHQYYHWSMPTDGNGKVIGDSSLRFQFRFDIGFGGKAWNSSIMYPRNRTERNGNNWNTRFLCGSALVDIYDETLFPGRQMTKASLDFSEKEFSTLLANLDDWKKLLPSNSCRKGNPDLTLRNSIQGGIYEAILWCNPGEKGTVYLKAFEITKGTPLSAARLKNSSLNVSGWSDDPQELFCTGMYFTIYEGEWEQYYGARFEVWFKPDNGGAERKLFEKNYKIQGWQR